MGRATWSERRLEYLAKQLLAQRRKGNYGDNGLKPQGVDAVTAAINKKFGDTLSKTQVKTAIYQSLKKPYAAFDQLKNNSGFGWDDEKKIATASDSVWKDYLQAHPEASRFRGKPFPLYEMLHEVFCNQIATGSQARSAFFVPPPPSSDEDASEEQNSGSGTGSGSDSDDAPPSPAKKKRQSTGSDGNKRGKKPKSAGAAIADAIREMNEITREEAVEARKVQGKSTADASEYGQAIALLEEAYEDIYTTREMVIAIDVLGDPKRATTFLSIKNSRLRSSWLDREIEKANRVGEDSD